MVFGCAAKTVKLLVFFFNFLAFLAGVAILVVSVVAFIKNDSIFGKLIGKEIDGIDNVSNLNYVLYAGMAVGALILLLGFLGCCGAMMESSCLLGLFTVILSLLIIAQLVIGILVIVKRDTIYDGVQKIVTAAEKNTGKPESSQDYKDACGFFKTLNDKKVCCDVTAKQNCKMSCQQIDSDTCVDKVKELIKSIGIVAGAIIIGILVLEVLAVLFACCLCCTIKDGSRMYH